MRDKLKKTGHTKAYFCLQRCLFSFLIAIAAASLAAIPVGISYKIAAYAEESSNIAASSSSEEKEEETLDAGDASFVAEESDA